MYMKKTGHAVAVGAPLDTSVAEPMGCEGTICNGM
jgi:hypothetical protein